MACSRVNFTFDIYVKHSSIHPHNQRIKGNAQCNIVYYQFFLGVFTFSVNRGRMNCDEYRHRSSAVVLLTLLVVVCGAKTTYQQQNRRFESITSCFLAEYARWRKLEQVIIFKNPTAGKVYFRQNIIYI